MKQLYRILMVEDTQDDALLIMRQVQKGDFDVQFERVETEAAFISALESQKWDIILCDYKLPTFNGIEALSILKKRGDDIPFIFVSGTMGEERAVEAMKHGARDYVMKGNLKRLLPAIERELTESKTRIEHKHIEEQIHFQALILNQISSAGIATDLEGNIMYWNTAAETLYGWTSEEVLGKKSTDFFLTINSQMLIKDLHRRVDQTGVWNGEMEFNRKDGTTLAVQVSSSLLRNISGDEIGILEISTDISERKRNEKLISLQTKVLKILASDISATEVVNELVAVIKQAVGYDAVGLRLKSGFDYPFVASLGYSDEFLMAENTLTHRYPSGGLCRNDDGTISLDCTCGLILSGKNDLTNPLFTSSGSAWTNNSLPFLDIPPEADPRLHPRNRCIHVGFLSLALIPIRAGADIIGLLHLADRNKNRFTLEIIEFFEGIGISIGVVLARRWAEEALQKNQSLLAKAEKLGKVGGWEFDIDTKQQTWTETVYNIHELDITCNLTVGQGINFYTPASRPIIERAVERAIKQGESFDMELEITTAKNNLRNIHVIGNADLAQRKISGFFQDITERKKTEEELKQQLKELQEWHEVSVGREEKIIELKREVNILLTSSGKKMKYDIDE